jgi:hypothetical protein
MGGESAISFTEDRKEWSWHKKFVADIAGKMISKKIASDPGRYPGRAIQDVGRYLGRSARMSDPPLSTKTARRDTATARSPVTLSAPARRVATRKPRKDELDMGAIKTLLGA